MASRTQIFQNMPWNGGVNTSIDELLIPPHQLTVANNVIFDTRGSKKKREGINYDFDDQSNSTAKILGLHDYWFGATTRTQRYVAVTSARNYYTWNTSGNRSTITVGGTAWSGTLTQASHITFNNLAIVAVDGTGNVPKYWDGNTSNSALDLPNAPAASILQTHLGRIWTNDKTNPDRLHYCETGDHTIWGGVGDSGALDVGVGDGDPDGIIAIFPSFKGDLFVAKRTKLYRIIGQVPELMEVVLVTNGVGAISHNAVAAIDQDDIVWLSERGIHTLSATDRYGDYEGAFLSFDIQRTFNSYWDRTRLKFAYAGYLPTINSVAFAVTETEQGERTNTTTSVNNVLWIYNFPLKAWYRWYDVPCSSLCVANDSAKKRFYLGTHTTRLARTQTGLNYDTNTSGTAVAVRFKVQTGLLFPDGSQYTTKAFKRFILYYTPRGTHTITATVKIDNFGLNSENSLNFAETSSTDLLGTTFILGTSALGYTVAGGAYVRQIDGIGRSAKITIEQTGVDQEVEIQGFSLEWEPIGFVYETKAEVT